MLMKQGGTAIDSPLQIIVGGVFLYPFLLSKKLYNFLKAKPSNINGVKQLSRLNSKKTNRIRL
ncbi:hypothetical protein CSC2_04020 [Clostridium zeae]|uniref:Uncharacterized protein n=1 Tax=Clostridium zeae TaxID=2759022 RepID=A0ABQ1E560_9CLOT|nr:hypothetical protein CSC2_04020 [Clostridium zeae]